MAIDFTSAVNAYQKVAKATENATSGKSTETTATGGSSFMNMVSDSLKSAVQTGRQAEELSLKQISGEADLKDVVTAVANAENTLETVVAVRDKVLSAYQEILRMPI
jgi:flagellar hook-basal body complex protein FliE